jgi:hypothetical protein
MTSKRASSKLTQQPRYFKANQNWKEVGGADEK